MAGAMSAVPVGVGTGAGAVGVGVRVGTGLGEGLAVAVGAAVGTVGTGVGVGSAVGIEGGLVGVTVAVPADSPGRGSVVTQAGREASNSKATIKDASRDFHDRCSPLASRAGLSLTAPVFTGLSRATIGETPCGVLHQVRPAIPRLFRRRSGAPGSLL